MRAHLKPMLPYFIILGAAVYAFNLTGKFVFAEMGDRIGPNMWPRLILLLLIGVCVWEIGRRALVAWTGHTGERPQQAGLTDMDADAGEEEFLPRVLGAIAVTVGYLALFEILGFFLDTLVYMALLMWLGRFNRYVTTLVLSVISSFVFMAVFMKAIFLSLPIGIEPFSKISLTIMHLLGI